MNYRVTEEISSFWYILGLPVLFGFITCFFILYIIGKSNRDKLFEWLVDDYKYVLENGVYIPFESCKIVRAIKKIGEFVGIVQYRAVLIIFMGLVVVFGGYNIVCIIFQPQLTYNANILFSSDIDNDILAVLWSKAIDSESLYSILEYVDENTNITNQFEVLYYTEAYIYFYIILSVFALFLSIKKRNIVEKKEIRYNAFKAIFILLVFLISVYILQIQNNDRIMEQKCQMAYYELNKNMLVPEYDEIEVYIREIEDMKKKYDGIIFYGAYSLKAMGVISELKFYIYNMIYEYNYLK